MLHSEKKLQSHWYGFVLLSQPAFSILDICLFFCFMCVFLLYLTESCSEEAAHTAVRTLIDLGVSDSLCVCVSKSACLPGIIAPLRTQSWRAIQLSKSWLLMWILESSPNLQITINQSNWWHFSVAVNRNLMFDAIGGLSAWLEPTKSNHVGGRNVSS